MDIKELENTLTVEITNRVNSIHTLADTISLSISSLSQEAVELHTYFKMARSMPIEDLANHCGLKPCELNMLIRACRLTANSPELNRALLSRFDLIP